MRPVALSFGGNGTVSGSHQNMPAGAVALRIALNGLLGQHIGVGVAVAHLHSLGCGVPPGAGLFHGQLGTSRAWCYTGMATT
jgi:hypothetical protein